MLFNREMVWDSARQHEILLEEKTPDELRTIIDFLFVNNKNDFDRRFIAESREKIQNIWLYYSVFIAATISFTKCNAPWYRWWWEGWNRSAPAFFMNLMEISSPHTWYDHQQRKRFSLISEGISTWQKNKTCVKCVCYLNLSTPNNALNEKDTFLTFLFPPVSIQNNGPRASSLRPTGYFDAAALMRSNNLWSEFVWYHVCQQPGMIPHLEKITPGFFVLYDDGFNYLTKMCLTNIWEAA